MTQLGADTPRDYELGNMNDLPVKAASTIYEGSAVGDDGSGYARQLVAADPFRGFAAAKADNAAGLAAAINVHVRQKGRIVLAVSGLAITDVGKPVFASDGATFTLTASTNTYVGRVVRYVSSGVGVIEFDASRGGLGKVADLTENSTTIGGTNDGNIATLAMSVAWNGSSVYPSAADSALIIGAIRELAAKVNELTRQVG